ncbi:DUF2004 domain-containing protein [Paraflavitalea sp. CAU 1676]|uniref:DUF2004 domain-containing protein n=1 Tax=Paraflavitalea sp. CAU 1676 TaxID=3032598 RepID=UPI0023DCA129|nr:DUF2004 domain-containing protein [Paraflavitalea sp. CAU 1676]MDF2189110.1 DUF2004 domain-containing protein [Paraflavitalea sp. CAU 1676]
MTFFELPFFGKINTDNLEEYYDTVIEFNGTAIELDLNFESNTIEPTQLEKVKQFLSKLDQFDKDCRKEIREDYDDEDADTVREYIDFHLENIEVKDLARALNMDAKAVEQKEPLVEKLQLVRLGLYPDSEDEYAIFDYSFGRGITDHLVVLWKDEEGTLTEIGMES